MFIFFPRKCISGYPGYFICIMKSFTPDMHFVPRIFLIGCSWYRTKWIRHYYWTGQLWVYEGSEGTRALRVRGLRVGRGTLTSTILLLWHRKPRYYDVTTKPTTITSLPPLLWRHQPRYYNVTNFFTRTSLTCYLAFVLWRH